MSLVIRRAGREDAGTLFSLITALAHYEKLEPPDAEARERMIRDGWGQNPRFEAWLAESNDEPVGYAITFETYSTFLARPTLYLEDLFVLPDVRAQGIGYALFRYVAMESLNRGCGRMEWACLDWNEPGLRFYERIGARPLGDWRYFRMMPEDIEALPDACRTANGE